MNKFKIYWKFYLGILIMVAFIVIRILLVVLNGPHDHNVELMSTLSMLFGFLSAYFLFTGLEDIDKNEHE